MLESAQSCGSAAQGPGHASMRDRGLGDIRACDSPDGCLWLPIPRAREAGGQPNRGLRTQRVPFNTPCHWFDLLARLGCSSFCDSGEGLAGQFRPLSCLLDKSRDRDSRRLLDAPRKHTVSRFACGDFSCVLRHSRTGAHTPEISCVSVPDLASWWEWGPLLCSSPPRSLTTPDSKA